MNFRPDSIDLILRGMKTQTRRPCGDGTTCALRMIGPRPCDANKRILVGSLITSRTKDGICQAATDGPDEAFAGIAWEASNDRTVDLCYFSQTVTAGWAHDERLLNADTDRKWISAVFEKAGRAKWRVGRTYAICPGRGKHAIPDARIRITSIRCERVCDISDKDVAAEGLRWDFDRGRWVYGKTVLEKRGAPIYLEYPAMNIAAYLFLWRSMYPKSDCTELCWVLGFELVKEGA